MRSRIFFGHTSASSDVSVNATTDALILTTYDATISHDREVLAGTDALVITTYDATVELVINISATTDALILTTYAASITYDKNVLAGTDALLITTYDAGIALAVNVSATTDALVLSTYDATITYDVNVLASSDALILTGNDATITYGVEVLAGTDALLLTGHTASLAIDRNVFASTDALTITTYAATVSLDAVEAPAAVGGGRSKKKSYKKPIVVEIDKQFFVVNSIEEAKALLDQALALAKDQAVAETERITRETLKKPPRVRRLKTLKRPVIASPAIAPVIKDYQERLDRIYADVIDAAIRVEITRRLEDEDEEDTIIALLLG